MSSIRAVGSPATVTYAINRTTVRAADSTPTPTVDPAARVDILTRQLDSSLNDKLTRIRNQISSNTNGSGGAQATPRRLDIRA
jgi:hypothetical protein